MVFRTSFDPTAYAASFQRDGYYVQENVVTDDDVVELRRAIAAIPDGGEVRKKRSVYGVRNLLEICPAVRALAARDGIRQFVTAILGEHAFAVRAIFFDKVADANWSLFGHQDNVIAVAQRRDVPGYTGWSQKAGIWQVQPPVEVLANMVSIRVHLDACGANDGPLRVLPGSHRAGWIDEQLDDWKARVPEVVCEVGCGGVVAMCPLTLHASARSDCAGHRRVIHVEYATAALPGGLEWRTRVG
jgi:ectoine hydroxylase-related dioxygenase (phytanoyl-CoA dioxygenase family)